MKTLTINGLVFTDQPPTKEGWWLWSEHDENTPIEERGADICEVLLGRDEYHLHCNFLDGHSTIKKGSQALGGWWHELIPRQKFAEEVEKAYLEGFYDKPDWGPANLKQSWKISNSKLVAEGKEPKV